MGRYGGCVRASHLFVLPFRSHPLSLCVALGGEGGACVPRAPEEQCPGWFLTERDGRQAASLQHRPQCVLQLECSMSRMLLGLGWHENAACTCHRAQGLLSTTGGWRYAPGPGGRGKRACTRDSVSPRGLGDRRQRRRRVWIWAAYGRGPRTCAATCEGTVIRARGRLSSFGNGGVHERAWSDARLYASPVLEMHHGPAAAE